MLDPWIIEEIRRREEAQRQEEARRSHLEIQIETPAEPTGGKVDRGRPKTERGVAIIDFSI